MELFHHLVLYNDNNEVQWNLMLPLNLLKIHETILEKQIYLSNI
jgi:hypothetical protein